MGGENRHRQKGRDKTFKIGRSIVPTIRLTAPTGGVVGPKGTLGVPRVLRAMQVKTVNALTQGQDRRQRSGVRPVESLQTGSPVVFMPPGVEG